MAYDLEARTKQFAKDVRKFCRYQKKDFINIDDFKQVCRSSGSIGANYIEANEALSKRDFAHRMKIARKEAKETHYWLDIIKDSIKETSGIDRLIQEATELNKICSAIINKSK